ncbi:hypothetical protein DM02DRAFT_613479 [Periconia macrospinosa]|uniref:NHL repeat-containing protein n=1 Tax=Periconia macrospinosa TaxID=97972 RepID=A0A2V1DUC0_9PLEO|nr:hypothetical protein DM02DRAFT_613479 [Periconia macrospinosa]
MKLFPLISTFSLATAAAVDKRAAVRQLVNFHGFAENIAIRENGHILITSLQTTSIQYFDPAGPNTTLSLPPIPGANGLTGIVEVEKDVFAVAAGIWNITAQRETNASVWTVDLRASSSPTKATLKKILEIPETRALNGFTVIPDTSIVLGSDSVLGGIYAIDIVKRTYTLVIQDVLLQPLTPDAFLGVNGIDVFKSALYFANSAKGIFGKIPIADDGTATGPAETISQFNTTVVVGIDDFKIDDEGNAYIAAHPNAIYKVDVGGVQDVIVSGDEILDPTSLALGRRGGHVKKGGAPVIYATVNRYDEADPLNNTGGVAMVTL